LTGSWSATVKDRTLAGTWTAQPHQDADAAWGAWSLMDTSFGAIASGSWAARKQMDGWRGRWNAEVEERGSYSGDWTAGLSAPGTSRLFELFLAAVNDVVGGTYQVDRGALGAWSIRTDGW